MGVRMLGGGWIVAATACGLLAGCGPDQSSQTDGDAQVASAGNPLPSYSPELNPVENIWQFLRQNYLANRVFATYETIVDACCHAWNALVAAPDTIHSIATRDWAKAVTS